ncbi:hypothetical protein K450DRAFT_248341 [Umbelopsis ramanniana AG]|uniref:Uncharacterized protein n=1 Tax=Umbelopsis ramanniana AG TaxID=1314678 RepID=A0AAD5E7I6_UMBRA|nr:uncharacterized protein K450DRAFT_248341 [Umbelopsis ramanniana AG]KAI8578149.1 hypothetical protein K450DRAFT_248341 [Umbelopsis ramanniana AG]
MNLETYFSTYFGVRILSLVLMLMLLYPALRSGKHRTLISLYVVECLSDINSIIFLGVEASKILATPTTAFVIDGVCEFTAYAFQSISTARSVLLLGLCINLWMAVHRPHINADRDWFWWYILITVVLSLLSSIPVFVWEHIHEPDTNAQTLFEYFDCYVNGHLISSAVIIYAQFSLNAVSMILMFHTTFTVVRHKIKVFRHSPTATNEIEKALQSRIVVRMMCCSVIASVVVFWLDLQAVIDMASNKDDQQNPTLSNASINIFIGVLDALFYFLAFGTTMEFVNTYFFWLTPLFSGCFKKRDRTSQSSYNRSRFTVASLPRFKSTFSTGAEPEGEWQELGSVIEPTESNKYQPGHV